MRRNSSGSKHQQALDDLDLDPPSSSVVPFHLDRQGGAIPLPARSSDLLPELRAEMSRVFGSAILADPVKAAAVETAAREFRHQGAKVLSAAVYMGRALIQLRDHIGMPALLRGMRESRLIFSGWSHGNLSKMMSVAEFVDSGGYSLDSLPQNWSTTYELTTLDHEQLAEARAGDLMRPDVTRSQLLEFKRRVLPSGVLPPAVDASSSQDLQAHLKILKQRLDRLARRMETTRNEIRDVDSRIASLKGRASKG